MNKIHKALLISNKVRRLIQAKVQLSEIMDVTLHDMPISTSKLRLAQEDIEYNIKIMKSAISRLIEGIPGYDEKRHKVIDYFSVGDIKDGFIDLTKNDTKTEFIDITKGEIVPFTEVPKEILE